MTGTRVELSAYLDTFLWPQPLTRIDLASATAALPPIITYGRSTDVRFQFQSVANKTGECVYASSLNGDSA
jgi:hypothetical protein